MKGRRELHFATLAEVQAEAERLASIRVRQLGNWPLGYSLAHLAGAMKMSLDGADFKAPFYIRWFAPLIKKGLLRGPMKPGFQLPRQATEQLMPRGEVSTQDGLDQLRTQIERLNREAEASAESGIRPDDARRMGSAALAARGDALELLRAGVSPVRRRR